MVETRRTESEKGRYTNLFLAASEDSERRSPKAPVSNRRRMGFRRLHSDAVSVTWLLKSTIFINFAPTSAAASTTGRRAMAIWSARSPDGISIELPQKGGAKEAAEPGNQWRTSAAGRPR